MADANVDALVQKVNQLVVLDSVEGVSSLRRGQTLELSAGHVEMLRPLADNLDLPGRLATALHSISGTQGRWHDRRDDARAGLTELVALCANRLEPDSSLPEPADAGARDRLATAVCRAYAASATPRLVAGLFPDGRPDDLGRFPPPQLEGDVAAARAMAVAIGARTASGEDQVLKRLVAAGHGAAAHEAAAMLLEARMDFARLPHGQRAGIHRQLTRSIEAGFAVRDVQRAAARELTEELENRREDVTGGAGAIDTASGIARDEVGKLHEFLQKIDYWEESMEPQPTPSLDEVRAIVARGLVSRVEHHARIQTDLPDSQVASPPAATAAAAETMVATSTIPFESRPAATAATATMLTEGFDELPTLVDDWRAGGSDVRREAEVYGGTLGDRTLAAVRGFELHPPNAQAAEPNRVFGTDPAIPPLGRVQAPTGQTRQADGAAASSRNKGSDGLIR
ncbi:hypothetical protein [Kribbella sp. VKM Ac-2566]|uniref:hypothetical protein n=1 Tax=Kribbella sp. VKM Ac-2566 TaxID=2512218 RepID=UPI00106443C4|nr:hypothetical protein [Kribbella sp. VKM Ac-2566]TDW98926.1 hypothetical protein EV647_3658 [Kribbella sp. VKM Ac-2566]